MKGIHLFTLAKIPVALSPWYLLLIYLFSQGSLEGGLVIGSCITLGLLVHEFGHALTARWFGLSPSVLLHGFGGLTGHRPARYASEQALIVAAGPAAGFSLGMLTLAVHMALGELSPALRLDPLYHTTVRWLFFVNLGWSVFNVVPLWPLDGGQLLRLGTRRLLPPLQASRVTHGVGVVLVAVGIYYSLQWFPGRYFNVVILGLLGWQNLQSLRRPEGPEPATRELRSPATRASVRGLLSLTLALIAAGSAAAVYVFF